MARLLRWGKRSNGPSIIVRYNPAMSAATIPCAWSGNAAAFLGLAGADVAAERLGPALPLLQEAIASVPRSGGWEIALDVRLLRLGRRIDAVVATERAVLAVQIRPGQATFTGADRLAAEDAALDLADFHAGSRFLPVIPVLLVPNGARVRQQYPLPLAGAAPVMEATRLTFPGLLRQVATFPPVGRDGAAWAASGYAPVPGLTEAACMLYANHGAAALQLAGAGPEGVRRTQAAVMEAIAQARAGDEKLVLFVTGDPGAGKTLCGLNLAFAPGLDAAFLTGNPTLVHVLREVLVRDAVARGLSRHAARRRMEGVIQKLPGFRDHYVRSDVAAPERIIAIDEAQRCWSRLYAVRKTRNRPVRLQELRTWALAGHHGAATGLGGAGLPGGRRAGNP